MFSSSVCPLQSRRAKLLTPGVTLFSQSKEEGQCLFGSFFLMNLVNSQNSIAFTFFHCKLGMKDGRECGWMISSSPLQSRCFALSPVGKFHCLSFCFVFYPEPIYEDSRSGNIVRRTGDSFNFAPSALNCYCAYLVYLLPNTK